MVMTRFVLIFLAGGCGCLLRYAVAGWTQRMADGIFPLGTLTVNLVGCAVIGFLASLFTGPVLIREEYRLAILVGLLGGFTTFSTYGWETIALADHGQWRLAATNVVASNLLGLAAAWWGARLAVTIYGS
jgi:CrcB protein